MMGNLTYSHSISPMTPADVFLLHSFHLLAVW